MQIFLLESLNVLQVKRTVAPQDTSIHEKSIVSDDGKESCAFKKKDTEVGYVKEK